MHVRVAKPSKIRTKKRRDVGLLGAPLLVAKASKTLNPARGKVTKFTVALPKKASRQLRNVGKAKRIAATSVVIDHRKDTHKNIPRGLVQIAPGPMAKGKYGSNKIARLSKIARLKVRRAHNPKAPVMAARLAGTIGNEPWFNQIVVSNGSPFIQQVNVNPNIQCMWTGSANSNLGASVPGVYPTAQVEFNYPYTSSSSQQPGLAGATDGMNAPGTQGTMMQDLVQAGVAAGQQALDDASNPDTYGDGGMIAAIGGVALKFGTTILGDYLKGTSSCDEVSTYPELFGVSTTVTGVYTKYSNSPEAWTALPYGGAQFSNIPGAGGTTPPTAEWVQANLNPMIGAQTSVTYYWNGGQPAPMVSNNASSGSYVGGLASYQGGLFQFAGPNPGSPSTVSYWSSNGPNPKTSSPIWSSTYENCLFGDNTSDSHYGCSMNDGAVNIQIGMLNNPLGNGGLWLANLNPAQPVAPEVSVEGNQQEGYGITCQIPNTPPNPPTTTGNALEATFQLPFAPNGPTQELQGGALTSARINAAGDQPSDAYYNVSYFAQNADGDFIYNADSVAAAGTNGMYQPYLAPNAAQQQVYINNPNIPVGQVMPADLAAGQLVTWAGPGTTPQAASADDIAQVGCSVSASLNLTGVDITDPTLSFGSAWPMPDGSSGGWPSSVPQSNYNFSWMTPVEQLNVTFQSMPVGGSVSVPNAG